MDSRHAGTTPKCFAKLAPNGMVSCFTSLPAAPVAVEEMVFFFFFYLISLNLMESLQRKLFQERSKMVRAGPQIFFFKQKPKAAPWRVNPLLSLV